MSDRPRIPSIMGELLQDPNVLDWLRARDLEAREQKQRAVAEAYDNGWTDGLEHRRGGELEVTLLRAYELGACRWLDLCIEVARKHGAGSELLNALNELSSRKRMMAEAAELADERAGRPRVPMEQTEA